MFKELSAMHDCVVVGAGPAGLTAAIYLGRFRRDVAVIDAGASRAARIPLSRNHPGFPEGVRGRTLLARMRRQAERYGASISAGRVEGLRRTEQGFRLTSEAGEMAVRAVLLATGVADVEPTIPGVDEAVAQGLIRICPICDGRLLVGEHQETSVPWLYAAGDVVRGLNQISTAEGEGAIAATQIHNRLREAGL
jgi:thioredoxin reductase (NADPH)